MPPLYGTTVRRRIKEKKKRPDVLKIRRASNNWPLDIHYKWFFRITRTQSARTNPDNRRRYPLRLNNALLVWVWTQFPLLNPIKMQKMMTHTNYNELNPFTVTFIRQGRIPTTYDSIMNLNERQIYTEKKWRTRLWHENCKWSKCQETKLCMMKHAICIDSSRVWSSLIRPRTLPL